MDITVLLAQTWGPVLLALGLGMFISRDYYMEMYRSLMKERLALTVFAVIAIIFGVIHVSAQNAWNTFPEFLISLIGWLLLAKGLVFAVYPKYVEKMSNWWLDRPEYIKVASWVILAIGVYLSYLGFLA